MGVDDAALDRIVGAMFDELEKIASMKERLLDARAARDAAADALAWSKARHGWKRFVPFTEAHRSHYQHIGNPSAGAVGRAKQTEKAYQETLEEARLADAAARRKAYVRVGGGALLAGAGGGYYGRSQQEKQNQY